MKAGVIKEGLFWLGVGVLFWGMGIYRIDPDFGQHLRTGYLIREQGIPLSDPFSYTMPSFPYIDHAWLTDVILAWLYDRIGMAGVAGIFAAAAVVTLMLLVSKGRTPGWWIPVLLGVTVLLPRGGVRPQVVDWLMLAVVLAWLGNETKWKRWRGLLPVLLALWTNLHGGVAVGLAVVAFVRVIKWREARKIDLKDAGVWAAGVGATFVNPYGPRMWQEVWMTMTDSNLKWTIGEWMPFFFTLEIGLLMLVAMILVAGLQYRREIPGWRLGLVAVFLAAGISSLRHMAFFALTAIPVVIWVLDRLYRQVAINPEQEKRAMKTYMVLGMLAAGILVWETGWTAYRWWRVANGDNFYPVRAVQFLKERNYQGELFAEYGWGGYLLWQYPEKKLFIDGRMPSMRWTAPSDRESDWAFKDYLDITGAGEIEPYFGKYDVGVVLWPKQSPTPIETLTAAIAKKFGQGEERKSFIQKLEEAGWEKVYEDKRAVIYVR